MHFITFEWKDIGTGSVPYEDLCHITFCCLSFIQDPFKIFVFRVTDLTCLRWEVVLN